MKAGTKFFAGHGHDTNSHEGRVSVGEVLSSFVKEISGKLTNIVIGHFPNKDVAPYDICSMEADIRTDEENIVGDIDEVSGIALGNSDKDSPAFPGALRLNVVQCFREENKTKPGEGEKDVPITFEEVKTAVKSMNIFPRQLFTVEDLQQDRTFGPMFEKTSTLEAENERLTKENTEIKASSKDALRQNEISKAGSRLDKLMEKGYTDKQRIFIKGRFDPEALEDLSDEALNAYLETGKNDFAETAKLFGNKDIVDPKPDPDADLSTEQEAEKLLGIGAE